MKIIGQIGDFLKRLINDLEQPSVSLHFVHMALKMQGLQYTHKGKEVVCMTGGWCVQALQNDKNELLDILRDNNEISIRIFLEKLLAKGDWVIDVGAGFGVFTHCAAYVVGALGKVIAIETDRQYADLLEDTVKMNNTQNRVTIQRISVHKKTIDDFMLVYAYIKCCKIDIYKDIKTIFVNAQQAIKESRIQYFLLRFRDTELDRDELVKNLTWIIDEMHYTLYLLRDGDMLSNLDRLGIKQDINPKYIARKLEQGQKIDVVLKTLHM